MDYHVSFLETENGSEYTWFWRDKDNDGVDLLCYLCPLLHRSVCFCSFALLFLSLYSVFFCVSLCLSPLLPLLSLMLSHCSHSLYFFSLTLSLPAFFFFSLFFSPSCYVSLSYSPFVFFFPTLCFFFQLSPPPNSVIYLAFIGRGCRSYGRNINRETCLLLIVVPLSLLLTPPPSSLPAVCLKKTMNSFKETTPF